MIFGERFGEPCEKLRPSAARAVGDELCFEKQNTRKQNGGKARRVNLRARGRQGDSPVPVPTLRRRLGVCDREATTEGYPCPCSPGPRGGRMGGPGSQEGFNLSVEQAIRESSEALGQ